MDIPVWKHYYSSGASNSHEGHHATMQCYTIYSARGAHHLHSHSLLLQDPYAFLQHFPHLLQPLVWILAEWKIQLGSPACGLLKLRGWPDSCQHCLVVFLLQVHRFHGLLLLCSAQEEQPTDLPSCDPPRNDANDQLDISQVSLSGFAAFMNILYLFLDGLAVDTPPSSCS